MDRVRRLVFEQRRLLAAACAGLAVLLALGSLQGRDEGVSVLVAARDLPSGHDVGGGDVEAVSMPAALVPDRAAGDVDAVVGRRVAGPVRRGEVITDVRVVSPGALAGRAPGSVLAPVRVADPEELLMLRVGDHVDVVAVAPDGAHGRVEATVVARGVEVVTLPADGAEARGAGLGVATDEETALAIAAAALDSRLSVLAAQRPR